MKLKATFMPSFSRDLKRIRKRGLDERNLLEVIGLIIENTPDSREELRRRHRMHSLKGAWKGSSECHVTNAVRMFVSAFNKRGGFPFNLSNPYGFSTKTLQAMDDAAHGRNLIGPFDSVEAMMEALDSDEEQHCSRSGSPPDPKRTTSESSGRGSTSRSWPTPSDS